MVGGIDDGITGHVGQVSSSQQGDPLVQLSCGVGGGRPPPPPSFDQQAGRKRRSKEDV